MPLPWFNNPGISGIDELTAAEEVIIASIASLGTSGQVLAVNGAADGVEWTNAGSGDVTAASTFGTDNVLVRSDGTGKGVQATGISVSDTTDDISGVGDLSMGGYIDMDEISAPANPAADVGRLYVADDTGVTTLYFRDSAGTVTDLLASAAGLSDVVDDTTPQLGGDLDGQSTYDLTNIVNADFAGYLDFDEIAEPSDPAANVLRLWAEDNNGFGQLHFKNSNGLDYQLGRDRIITVRNNTGGTISTGEWVYLSGSTGSVPEVTKARANSSTTMPAVGVAVADISTASFGQIMIAGDLRGVDTSAFSAGDILYISPSTAGAVTTTEPTGTNIDQEVGEVITVNASNGVIFVNPQAAFDPGTTNTLTNKTIDTANNTITVVEADISDLQSYLVNVVEDTTPQLGGTLASNGSGIAMADSDSITFGTGNDLTITHNGTNTTFVNTTGDIQFDNQAVNNISFTLGSDTAGAAFIVENNSGTNIFEVEGDGSIIMGGTVEVGGNLIQGVGNVRANSNVITLNDNAGNEILQATDVTSAVNYLDVRNAATGTGPEIAAEGDDTNIDIELHPKGTGRVKVSAGDGFDANNHAFGDSVLVDNGNSGTADTIDWGSGNFQKSTLTDNCTFTFTDPPVGGRFQLKLHQDGTGSRTVTWPGTVKWPGGTAPTLSTAASAIDIITFYYDADVNLYYGVASLDFS